MKYYSHFTGHMPVDAFVAGMIFATIGFFIHKTISASLRNRASQRTPGKFSPLFWIKDNWVEMLSHLLFIYAAVRFAPEIVTVGVELGLVPQWVVGFFKNADNMAIYLFIGWVLAYPISKIKKKLSRK